MLDTWIHSNIFLFFSVHSSQTMFMWYLIPFLCPCRLIFSQCTKPLSCSGLKKRKINPLSKRLAIKSTHQLSLTVSAPWDSPLHLHQWSRLRLWFNRTGQDKNGISSCEKRNTKVQETVYPPLKTTCMKFGQSTLVWIQPWRTRKCKNRILFA